MIFRQSSIRLFQECPLRFRFQADGMAREQSSAMSFGSVIHEAIMELEVNYDLARGVAKFDSMWDDLPNAIDQFGKSLEYNYLIPRYNHDTYRDLGHRILRDWWMLVQWDTDVVLAREYAFDVPISEGHRLIGTVDKVVLRTMKDGSIAVVTVDYKTGSKQPTREYLAHDIQFSSYCYATTQPEFWTGIPNGAELFEQLRDAERHGEWIHVRTTKRIPAGIRTEMHYNRLRYACEQMQLSIDLGIFMPDLTGEKCEFCEFRKVCGLPSRQEEGLE